jgi:hypothetical protein
VKVFNLLNEVGVAVFQEFYLVARVGAVNDALGADGVAATGQAVVADELFRVGVAECTRRLDRRLRLRYFHTDGR